MASYKRHLVTAALPYANGPVHIGQLAGAYIPADIYVRYLRAMGEDVAFICGSDEHGAAITIQAKREGVDPKAIVDKYHALNKAAFEGLGISFDIFHRTSSALHHETASEFFLALERDGLFEIQESEQLYDEQYGQFLADRYVTGTCPRCGNPKAYGDQCEVCGSTLSTSELINPVSMLSGEPPVPRITKHWYFPLDRFQDWLRAWLVDGEGRDEEWKRNVLGQVKSWLDDGLRARSVTRDLDWGVKVPLPDAEGKVLYVWFDAPIGYISATRQWAADTGRNWKTYWQDPGTKLVHFLGKDNIVFHCIFFPSMLKAHGDYILPANVPANEFMNMEGDKLSTSRNWAVWVPDYLERFEGKQDELRYVLGANLPETKDSEFTWRDYQARTNNELVATFGNFVNRVMVLSAKYYDGEVPHADSRIELAGAEQNDKAGTARAIMGNLAALAAACGEHIRAYRFRDAQRSMMEMAAFGNGFLQFNEPWKYQKSDPEHVKAVMFCALQIVELLGLVAEPFTPFAAGRIRRMLGKAPIKAGDLAAALAVIAGGGDLLRAGDRLGPPELLFEKVEDEVVQHELDLLAAVKAAREVAGGTGGEADDVAVAPEGQTPGADTASTPAAQVKNGRRVELKDQIAYEDFAKLDIRTGTILSAEAIPKADKLLRLEVDLGFETRTIVSGIAAHFTAEELPGRHVLVLANLAPRKLRGVESMGMILMAEAADGRLLFVGPEKATENGVPIS